MLKLFAEALTAWKGQRDMMKDRTQTSIAPSTQPAMKTGPCAGFPNSDPKQSLEEKIRCRAYLLAEAAGFPPGRADDFWRQAEKEIRSGKS
jgi:hypothetical protein